MSKLSSTNSLRLPRRKGRDYRSPICYSQGLLRRLQDRGGPKETVWVLWDRVVIAARKTIYLNQSGITEINIYCHSKRGVDEATPLLNSVKAMLSDR